MNWEALKTRLNRTTWKDGGYQTQVESCDFEHLRYLRKQDVVQFWRSALAACGEDGMTYEEMQVILKQLEAL